MPSHGESNKPTRPYQTTKTLIAVFCSVYIEIGDWNSKQRKYYVIILKPRTKKLTIQLKPCDYMR